MPFFYIDPYYIYFVIPPLIISIIAQIKIKSAFNKYSKISSEKEYTGEELARLILDRNSLYNVRVEYVQGNLSDHFDPRANVVRLSESTYNSKSVAALGVAAHEVGHAIQYSKLYFPIKIRNAIIPITQIGSSLAMPLAFLGIFMSFQPLIFIGILLFVFVVLFQLITLPVEFNASRRALTTLREYYILNQDELLGAKKVLSAAAMTYVAALLVSLGSLLRLILLANRRNQ